MQSCVVVKKIWQIIHKWSWEVSSQAAEKYETFQVYREAAAEEMEEKQVVDVVVIKIIKWKK
jgi:hypothetical protein